MTTQWYYRRAGNEYGPVSSQELKRLAAAGEIAPTDGVRRNDRNGWTPAARVHGLFPPVPPSGSASARSAPAAAPPTPPPLPVVRPAASPPGVPQAPPQVSGEGHSNDKGWLSKLASNTRAAGELVVKQSERTKLAKITLPEAYWKLGQHIYADNHFRGEFADHYQVIDDLEATLQAACASIAPADGQHVAHGKARALAGTAKAAVNRKRLEHQRRQAFTTLGQAVFEKYGEHAGPEELATNVLGLRSQLAALDAEVAELSQAGQGQVFMPKRIAIGGGVVAVLLVLFGLKFLFFPARPVYAHLEDDYRESFESHKAQLLKTYGVDDPDLVPRQARKASFEQFQREMNVLFADIEPPQIFIDESAAELISDVSIGPPKFNSFIFGHYWTFPLKLAAKSRIDRYGTNLRYKTYAPDGTVVSDGRILIDTHGMPGERVSGRTDAVDAEAFFQTHHFRIFLE